MHFNKFYFDIFYLFITNIDQQIFKNLLKNLTYNEVIVTKDNLEFYKISKNYQSQLQIQPMDI